MEEKTSIFLYISKITSNNIIGDLMIINDSRINKKIKDNSIDKNNKQKALLSFAFGGFVGFLGELIYVFYYNVLQLEIDTSMTLTSATFIIIAFILTCFGVFDKLVCIAYSGLIIPITGFANSITSSALEGKSEGLIFGIGGKMFSLIGSVFAYGIVSSIIFGFIYYILRMF